MSRFSNAMISVTSVKDIQNCFSNGMDVNFRVLDGKTALHFAVQNRKFDVVKFLVENGAEIDVQDDDKYILIF